MGEDENEGEEEKEETRMRQDGGISDEEMEREVKRMSSGGDVSVEEEERQVKKMLAEDGEMSDEEEERETKRVRVGEGDVSVEGKSMALKSPPPFPADECEPTSLASKKSKGVMDDINRKASRESRSVAMRIESGIFSQIPSEVFHHILKFLSSEVPITYRYRYHICKCVTWMATDS